MALSNEQNWTNGQNKPGLKKKQRLNDEPDSTNKQSLRNKPNWEDESWKNVISGTTSRGSLKFDIEVEDPFISYDKEKEQKQKRNFGKEIRKCFSCNRVSEKHELFTCTIDEDGCISITSPGNS